MEHACANSNEKQAQNDKQNDILRNFNAAQPLAAGDIANRKDHVPAIEEAQRENAQKQPLPCTDAEHDIYLTGAAGDPEGRFFPDRAVTFIDPGPAIQYHAGA
jgi:hypothetical protein